jgi:SPP1 gp7 family putative phage head morphogenesis protein
MANAVTLATRGQVYLERLKAGYVKKYGKFTGRIETNLRLEFAKLKTDSMAELSNTALSRLIVAIDKAHLAESRPAMDGFQSELEPLAEYSAKLEKSQLEKNISNPPRFAEPTAELAYKRALDNPIQATGEGLLDFVDTWPEADVIRLNKMVRIGWAQGLTNTQMLRKLIDEGLERTARDAAAVMQTAVQHVATQARLEFMEENSDLVEGYEWVSTLDNKTSQQCRSLDGNKYKPGKGPLPPIHIRCRSSIAPTLSKEFDFLDDGATRASSGAKGGAQVDAGLSYYEWLKTQPADFQNVALGPQRAKLFRDGGLSADRFATLNLSKNFEPLTLEEMRRIEPDAFKLAGV